MSVEMTSTGTHLVLSTEIEVTGSITSTNNKLFFVISKYVPDYEADYVNKVMAYSGEIDFNITEIGEIMHAEHSFELDPDWDLTEINAVAIVQSWTDSKDILQAASYSFSGIIPMFSTNVQTGPPRLSVQFTDCSFSEDGIVSWEWDLDGDYLIDSFEQNPNFIYNEEGSYDITLWIHDSYETVETTFENYITVTDCSNISGALSGFWTATNNPYIITDDVYINEESALLIGPRVEIIVQNNSQIEVFGRMAVNTYRSNPVVFTSDSVWQGIKFTNTQESNTFYNCHISNANNCAIYVESSIVEITNCRIFGNSGTNLGAAVNVLNSDDILLHNNVISNNINSGSAGVLNFDNSNPTVTNNIIVNNTGNSGGIISCFDSSNGSFVNNTISNNLSESGRIFLQDSSPVFKNSILAENGELFESINAAPVVVYSQAYEALEGLGNILDDPLFVEPSEGDGAEFDGLSAHWYLEDNSPCIDTGHPSETYNDVEDPENPGFALFPAMGLLRNDMGAFGGDGFADFVGIEDQEQIDQLTVLNKINVYPNPFGTSTNIALQLHAEDQKLPVKLGVYNIKGQLVKTIVNNYIVNDHILNWNGNDKSGEKVASGIYFLRLETNSTTNIEKLLLIK